MAVAGPDAAVAGTAKVCGAEADRACGDPLASGGPTPACHYISQQFRKSRFGIEQTSSNARTTSYYKHGAGAGSLRVMYLWPSVYCGCKRCSCSSRAHAQQRQRRQVAHDRHRAARNTSLRCVVVRGAAQTCVRKTGGGGGRSQQAELSNVTCWVRQPV